MIESLDDHDVVEQEDVLEQDGPELPVTVAGAEALFGNYSVLSPGVEIILEGRPVSAPAAD